MMVMLSSEGGWVELGEGALLRAGLDLGLMVGGVAGV